MKRFQCLQRAWSCQGQAVTFFLFEIELICIFIILIKTYSLLIHRFIDALSSSREVRGILHIY